MFFIYFILFFDNLSGELTLLLIEVSIDLFEDFCFFDESIRTGSRSFEAADSVPPDLSSCAAEMIPFSSRGSDAFVKISGAFSTRIIFSFFLLRLWS